VFRLNDTRAVGHGENHVKVYLGRHDAPTALHHTFRCSCQRLLTQPKLPGVNILYVRRLAHRNKVDTRGTRSDSNALWKASHELGVPALESLGAEVPVP
jgi:hypothetical protein